MKEMKYMTMSKREFTNTAKRYAKTYWDITLDITIKWESHQKNRSYAWCSYEFVRNAKGSIIERKPTSIVMNIPRLTELNDERLLDTLKHELTHWACMKMNKPSSDGTKFFEKELLRIGASSSGFDMLDKDLKKKSIEYQKEIIERKSKSKARNKVDIVDGEVSRISIYAVYENASLKARYNEEDEDWLTFTWGGLQYGFALNTKWFFQFIFLLNGEKGNGFIAQKEDGTWTMAQGSNHLIDMPKTFRLESKRGKLHLSRKVQNQIRNEVISDAENLLLHLGLRNEVMGPKILT